MRPRCNNNNNKTNKKTKIIYKKYGLVVEHMSSMTEGLGVISSTKKRRVKNWGKLGA